MSFLFDTDNIIAIKHNRELINKITFVFLLSTIIASIVCIFVIIYKEKCEDMTTIVKKDISKPYKYTKITKQYCLTKNDLGKLDINTETNIESNIKNEEFTKLVADLIDNKPPKNI